MNSCLDLFVALENDRCLALRHPYMIHGSSAGRAYNGRIKNKVLGLASWTRSSPHGRFAGIHPGEVGSKSPRPIFDAVRQRNEREGPLRQIGHITEAPSR